MVRKLEALIVVGLLCVIAAVTTNWALKGAIHFKKDVLVPDIVGKPIMDALTMLSEQNLGLKKETGEFDDTIPAGTVLRQQPASGLTVREGKIIRVTISQGGETVFVPEIIEQSLRSAEISLRHNLLSLGEIQPKASIKYEKDVVISQKPEPRTIIAKNSFVHLVISDGPPQDGSLLMPDFIGKKWSEAEKWSEETDIKVKVTEDISSSESETVLEQSPEADSPVQPGDTVQFVIASLKSPSVSETIDPENPKFYFEVPQGESSKQYRFVIVDSSNKREIWRGRPAPGSKLDIPLPAKVNQSARIRIFVNGILTEERRIAQ